jgi:hypothetical protein
MTGASYPLALDDHTLSFQLPRRTAKNGARRVTVELTPMDVYTVVFWKFDRATMKLTEISRHEDIYFDALCQCFERETGLATSL